MCRAVVYHCETPVAEPWRPSNLFPRRAAETLASPQQMEPPAFLVSFLQAKKRWSERWTGSGPHHRCQKKAETPARPCWEGAGPEQVQSQPLDPLCQHLSGGACALFLSSLLLIHTVERCCGAASSFSLLPATNPDTKITTRQFFQLYVFLTKK